MKLTQTEKNRALGTLAKVIDKMAEENSLAETHEDFSKLSPSSFVVGNYTVKVSNGIYSVYSKDMCLYNDIVVAEVVFKLLDKMIQNKTSGINNLLKFEKEYVKHINDMKFYLHSFKQAQKTKSEHRFVMQDRFEISSIRAEKAKLKIRKI